uniref:Methyltransferase FkbM domain-containing protein n=1 Tax=uncultured Helicobacter sp. TaxID=175537 RepID=A0A650EKU1_9HELI|nr:hypothetical protein Helico4rc_1820 [uncultured Helicobacter sp.]
MRIVTKEIQDNKKIRKICGIPVLTTHKKYLSDGKIIRKQYKLFGMPIYQRSKHSKYALEEKIDRIEYLIDTLWLSNLQNERFEGQLGQDALAYSILRQKKNGFFVDIGAHDGISINNSYLFERLGWSGFCVEANPQTYAALKKNRKCDTYNLAIFSKNIGMTTLVASDSDCSALDTLEINLTQSHKERIDKLGGAKTISVQTATFNEIMQHYPDVFHIDFMTLDVEGGEMEVLRGIDFDKYTFSVMTIEHNYTDAKYQIIDFLHTKGYRVLMQNAWDIMFVKSLHIEYKY